MKLDELCFIVWSVTPQLFSTPPPCPPTKTIYPAVVSMSRPPAVGTPLFEVLAVMAHLKAREPLCSWLSPHPVCIRGPAVCIREVLKSAYRISRSGTYSASGVCVCLTAVAKWIPSEISGSAWRKGASSLPPSCNIPWSMCVFLCDSSPGSAMQSPPPSARAAAELNITKRNTHTLLCVCVCVHAPLCLWIKSAVRVFIEWFADRCVFLH